MFGPQNRVQLVKVESDVRVAQLPSIAPRPTEQTTAPWTLIVSVIGVAVLAEGSAALPPGPANELPFVLGSLLLIPVLGTLLLPWQRHRRWMTLIPSVTFTVAATLLVISLGGAT